MNTNINFDTSALSTRILTDYGTIKAFAAAVHMSSGTLASRLDGKTNFRHSEIMSICDLMNLSNEEVNRYFFTEKSEARTRTQTEIELAKTFLDLNENQRALVLNIMELITGRPDRREIVKNWTGKMRDLPAALRAM